MNGFNVTPLGGFNPAQGVAGMGQAFDDRRELEQQEQQNQLVEQQRGLIKRVVEGDESAIPELYTVNPQLGQVLEQRLYERAGAQNEQQQQAVKQQTEQFFRGYFSRTPEQRQQYLQQVSQDPQFALVTADDELLGAPPEVQEAEAKMGAYGLLGEDWYKQFVGGGDAPEYSNVKVSESGQLMGLNKGTGRFEIIDAPEQVRDAAPQVQVGSAETEEQKALGKFRGESYSDIQKKALSARQQQINLNALERLGDKAFSGTGAQAQKAIAKLANTVGLDVEGLPESEVYEALANTLVLEKSEMLTGVISDRDMAFLQNAAPQLSQSKEGRKKLVELTKAINQRQIQYAKDAAEYRKQKGSFDVLGFEDWMRDKYEGKDFLTDFYPVDESQSGPIDSPALGRAVTEQEISDIMERTGLDKESVYKRLEIPWQN